MAVAAGAAVVAVLVLDVPVLDVLLVPRIQSHERDYQAQREYNRSVVRDLGV